MFLFVGNSVITSTASSQPDEMPSAQPEKHNVKPAAGYVPDETVAIAIAEAVLTPIYGREKIRLERPFTAVSRGDVWIVQGSPKKKSYGGVAVAEIARSDGHIVRVTHGR